MKSAVVFESRFGQESWQQNHIQQCTFVPYRVLSDFFSTFLFWLFMTMRLCTLFVANLFTISLDLLCFHSCAQTGVFRWTCLAVRIVTDSFAYSLIRGMFDEVPENIEILFSKEYLTVKYSNWNRTWQSFSIDTAWTGNVQIQERSMYLPHGKSWENLKGWQRVFKR